MTIDKQKLRKDADTIFGNGPGLLMAIPAADVRGLLAEIERIELISRISCNHDGFKAVLDERDQLKTENEALRKDAERYRWLRDKQTFIWLIQDWFPGEAMLTNVDADIDAAMAKEVSHG
ncbi:hypothetical protein Q1Z72_19565 [Pseudomonas qingdaonensis]|uniref:hypothetical protein n=1 Tax=Pseudomonas qingdaonensis TaxID=2056231 RepID=UPI00265EAE12|nr:hypothetical protein [Pseudomonas qingdaonensis]WKL65488.1 hypothetical protein Q1Z72_19565 [Pseudomonas qingdaonensis]